MADGSPANHGRLRRRRRGDRIGFAPASRRLNMSPPSVTRAVSELEARLGARLVHRTTRSVRLTDAGQRYLEDCRRIISDVDEADRHAAGIHAAPRGMVSISATAMFGRIILAPILLDLLDRYPEISVTTLFVNRTVHLVDKGIDVAVRMGDLPDSSLSAIRVGGSRRARHRPTSIHVGGPVRRLNSKAMRSSISWTRYPRWNGA